MMVIYHDVIIMQFGGKYSIFAALDMTWKLVVTFVICFGNL